ncbi:MAG: polysaccharide biosynthesis/export family protein [Opitutaceae bacterium]|nr:polysaccharide biosynthesis/export family protein [Opitutaceae bacterium]
MQTRYASFSLVTFSRSTLGAALAACALLLAVSGCQAPVTAIPEGQATTLADALKLREGDVIRIAFPGTPSLDTTQTIRRDGRVTLSMLGELRVVGLSPLELEKLLMEKYASQLVSKEVSVSVVSSTYSVYVTGAVLSQGEVKSDKPLTVLEAIMKGGGFDFARANTRAVSIVRSEDGKNTKYTVDLQKILDGQQSEPFYLLPGDVVYVPVKFRWF